MAARTVNYTDNNMVQLIFERGAEPFFFRDAIVMPLDQFVQYTEAELIAMEDERYNNWLAIVNPPVDPNPPVTE